MNIRTTSKSAYEEHKTSGKLGEQQKRILIFLLNVEDASRREIAEALGMDTSSVSGRVNEMLNAKIISEGHPRKCKVSLRTINPVMA